MSANRESSKYKVILKRRLEACVYKFIYGLKMPSGRTHRLVVLGGERVGKTAIIEQLVFGNHIVGQVRTAIVCPLFRECYCLVFMVKL